MVRSLPLSVGIFGVRPQIVNGGILLSNKTVDLTERRSIRTAHGGRQLTSSSRHFSQALARPNWADVLRVGAIVAQALKRLRDASSGDPKEKQKFKSNQKKKKIKSQD
jgi:hypothetical protein